MAGSTRSPLQILDEGTSIGTTGRLNFIGGSVSASADSVNNRVNITISAGGMPGVFSPKDYGAAGNGSTDDTAAVQAAVQAALDYKPSIGQGTVLITPGIYRITSPIDVNGTSNANFTGISLIGMGGFWNCVLKYDPPNPATAQIMFDWTHNNSNYEGWNLIENIWFQGPGSGAAYGDKQCTCINLTGESDWQTYQTNGFIMPTTSTPLYRNHDGHYFTTIRGCRFDNWQKAVTGYGTLVNRFENSIFENCWKGIQLEGMQVAWQPGANANVIRDCRFVGSSEGAFGGGGNCIHIKGSGTLIDGCNIEYYAVAPTGGLPGGVVLELGGEGGVTRISNCWFESALAPTNIHSYSGHEPVIIDSCRFVAGNIKLGTAIDRPTIISECHGGTLENPTGSRPVRVQRCTSFSTAGNLGSGLVATDNF